MTNKSKKILAEISAGELLDKMTILEIKLTKIKDKENLLEISKEYESLKETKRLNIKLTENLENLIIQLKEINLKLWNIEDKTRICEKNKDFGQTFVDLSRSVYLNNDLRANIKSKISRLLLSTCDKPSTNLERVHSQTNILIIDRQQLQFWGNSFCNNNKLGAAKKLSPTSSSCTTTCHKPQRRQHRGKDVAWSGIRSYTFCKLLQTNPS